MKRESVNGQRTKNNGSQGIKILAAVVFLLIIAQAVYLNYMSKSQGNDGQIVNKIIVTNIAKDNGISAGNLIYQDQAVTSVCINNPPQITYDCNLTNIFLFRNDTVECQFNTTDVNKGQNITYSTQFLTTPDIFNISPTGLMNFSAPRSAMGKTNVFRIYANDNSGCSNSFDYREYNLTIDYDNRAPYLYKNIDNQQITKDHYYSFYLTDHFADPDSDQLNYFYILNSESHLNINIFGNLVLIQGTSCGLTQMYYVAVDYGGLTATSNDVTYNITCPVQTNSQNTGSTSTGGNGQGGGQGNRLCISNWKCGAWSPCSPDNSSYQQCIDYNGCNPKNYEHFTFKNCTYYGLEKYCNEKWDCNDWSTCDNGVHTRMCLDMDACSTNRTRPVEHESCDKISSCFNGIQDNGETGVDCGGLCGVCRNVEQPYKSNNPITTTIIAAGITVGLTALAAFLLKSNLLAFIRKMSNARLARKKKLYITSKQKDKLMRAINIIQTRVDEKNIDLGIEQTVDFMNEYFKQLLAIEKFDKDDLIRQIIRLKDKDLEKSLIMFYAKLNNIINLHYKDKSTGIPEIQELMDEMTYNTYLIGGFTDADAINAIKDRAIQGTKTIDQMYGMISNIYIALNFQELVVAKNTYREILKDYETLQSNEKKKIYNDIIRTFHAIEYLEKQLKK